MKKVHYDKAKILRWIKSACGSWGECTKDKTKVTCLKCKSWLKKRINDKYEM